MYFKRGIEGKLSMWKGLRLGVLFAIITESDGGSGDEKKVK